MRGMVGQTTLIIILLLASAWFFLNAWATLDLYYNYPGAGRQATIYLAVSGVLLAAAIWRAVVVIRRRRRNRPT